MKVHLNAQQPDEESEGELPLAVMKKYIAYCKRYTFYRLKIHNFMLSIVGSVVPGCQRKQPVS